MNINEWLRNHPVDCSRGAPLGDSGQEGRKDYPYTFYLQRIKMIDHDYDSAGTYWGIGKEPLRSEAKIKINAKYPNARFFR